MLKSKIWTCAALLAAGAAMPAAAQAPNAELLGAQAKAMATLSFLDGEWAGPAEANEPKGVLRMTQTERSGTLLDGTIRLVEGRSFDKAGKTLFNAFAVISYDVRTSRYMITSHASGYSTTAELKLVPNGFEWDVPAGPSALLHFSATVKDGLWTEVGDFIGPDGTPRRTFEMKVRKLRATTWPAQSAVKYK
ncbi:MAG TPA: DUF1579 domain-containing protein [Allosphingosinicella sp.]|jgi:hypothetical protein